MLNGQMAFSSPPRADGPRPTVLFLLESGLDLRSFSTSGLVARLHETHDVMFAVDCDETAALFDARAERVPHEALGLGLPWTVHQAKSWADRARLAQTREQLWKNFPAEVPSGLQQRLLRRVFAAYSGPERAIVLAERAMFAAWPTSPVWRHFVARRRVSVVVASTIFGHVIEAFRTAPRRGVRTVLLENSFKDAFTRPGITPMPSLVVTPSPISLLRHLKTAPADLHNRFALAPSLHTIALLRARVMDRASFCARVGLDPDRPIVCYTAAAPQAVAGEPDIVRAFLDSLADAAGPAAAPQILVRLNPMERDPALWTDVVSGYTFASLQRPMWGFRERGLWKWNIPYPSDTDLWLSTIQHSTANVSVASTVTQEFLMFGKPVVNVCFDRPGTAESLSNLRFYHAPFYAHYHTAPGVHAAHDPESLSALARRLAVAPGELDVTAPRPESIDEITRLILGSSRKSMVQYSASDT